MSIFKERAVLRNGALKKLLSEMEKKRDLLLDELSHKKGQVQQIEETIGRVYELILDINKEEQNKEAEDIARVAREKAEKETIEKKEIERKAFEEAKKGIKTPKKERART